MHLAYFYLFILDAAWDFFSQGQLKVKVCSEFPTAIDFSSCPPQSTTCFSSPAMLLPYFASLYYMFLNSYSFFIPICAENIKYF